MALRKRKVWIIAGSVFLLCSLALGIGISRRRTTEFPKFYELASSIGERKSAAATSTLHGSSFIVLRATARHSYVIATTTPITKPTVFIFAKRDADRARALFEGYFPTGAPVARLAAAVTYPKPGRVLPLVEVRHRSKVAAIFAEGAPADFLAKDAGMTLPPGGVAITLDEEPDWFTMKIQTLLHFLHLR